MDFEDVLREFGKAVGKLKTSYAEKYGNDPSYIQIFIDRDNYITITPTMYTGNYIETFRDWIDTEISE